MHAAVNRWSRNEIRPTLLFSRSTVTSFAFFQKGGRRRMKRKKKQDIFFQLSFSLSFISCSFLRLDRFFFSSDGESRQSRFAGSLTERRADVKRMTDGNNNKAQRKMSIYISIYLYIVIERFSRRRSRGRWPQNICAMQQSIDRFQPGFHLQFKCLVPYEETDSRGYSAAAGDPGKVAGQ